MRSEPSRAAPTALPEVAAASFVTSQAGVIVHKHIGPVSAKDLERTILPLIERLQR